MIGKIFVTGSGCDPVKGKHRKDPYLGPKPSRGAGDSGSKPWWP